MKTKLHIVLILTLSLVWFFMPQAVGLATTYYVDGNSTNASDSNPGTSGLPWKTIGKAASSLQPGDTALVREGIYREEVDIRIKRKNVKKAAEYMSKQIMCPRCQYTLRKGEDY